MAEMSLMESLARGLRGAGGVLSPRVYEDIAASDRQEAALRQQVQMKLYEQKIRDERERALGEAVRPALESGNLDQAAAAAAATPGGFQTGMTLLGQAEARKARAETLKTQLEQRAQDLQMRHEQRLEELQQRGADARALAQERQDFQRQMAQFQQQGQQALVRLTASLRPERQPQIVTNTEGTFERQSDGTWKKAMGGDGKPIPGKAPAGSGGHLTEGESKGTLFYSQMKSANDEIKGLVGPDFDVNKLGNQFATRLANSDYTNWAAPEKAQRYNQAAEQWAEAYLRLKTGAATNNDEIKRNARAYFPQPGDNKKTVDQKNRMRLNAERDVSIVAGRGIDKLNELKGGESPPGVPPPPPGFTVNK